MTYAALKALTSSLLIGDKKLPSDSNTLLPLVDYGLYQIAMEAEALKLMTKYSGDSIIRVASNNMYIRKAKLPSLDDELMDLDNELCYALANYIASFLSAKRASYFKKEAKDIINSYNSKIYDIIMSAEFDPETERFTK